MNLKIFYFSGTGNSKQVATWLSVFAGEKNMGCEITRISKTVTNVENKISPESLIVIISPVHGFNYPKIVLDFLWRFPKGNNRVVLMNTRAGMKLGRFVTPGLTGIAFYLASVFLLIKGYKIWGMLPVDLPSNWTSLHPGLNKRTVAFLHEKMRARVKRNADKMLEGKKIFPFYYELIPNLLIAPISLAYYVAGRYMIAKTFVASDDCNNCNLCIATCPVKAIKMVDNRPFWTFKCESCMKCMSSCPKKAIETAHGSIAVFAVLVSLFALPWFYKGLEYFLIEIQGGLAKFAIKTVLVLLLIWGWYRIIHLLMRFRFIERLIAYTSLTRFKFWRKQYKSLNLN